MSAVDAISAEEHPDTYDRTRWTRGGDTKAYRLEQAAYCETARLNLIELRKASTIARAALGEMA